MALNSGVLSGGNNSPSPSKGGSGIAGQRPYISSNVYLHAPGPCVFTATNTNTLTTDTVYAMSGWAAAPFVLTHVTVQTSSSNASNGAAVKIGVYTGGADGKPATLIGSTAAGTSITNAATSTAFTIALDSPVNVPYGQFFIAILPTATTTAVRLSTLNTSGVFSALNGASSVANAIAPSPQIGYTAPQAYASGLPSAPTWTAYTSISNSPACWFTVQ